MERARDPVGRDAHDSEIGGRVDLDLAEASTRAGHDHYVIREVRRRLRKLDLFDDREPSANLHRPAEADGDVAGRALAGIDCGHSVAARADGRKDFL
jgi:hypothetical protein